MKNALVIGASSGYGYGIAQVLEKDYNVIKASRSSFAKLDVRNPQEVELFFEYFKNKNILFDIVVYSAGKAIGKDVVSDKNASDFNDVFQTNTLGLLYVAKEAFKHLKITKGNFIHIGSIAHALNYKGGADYCASKSASNTIMKTIRLEWLGTGIKTTSIEVGLGETNFQKNRYSGDIDKMQKHTTGVRQIKPNDLGKLVKYIVETEDYLNFDEIVLKPLDQASHGITINNINNQF